MDSFVEQIVVKKKTWAQVLTVAVVCMIAVFLIAVSILLVRIMGLLSAIIITAVFYGAWYLLTAQNIEYEYCITNDTIDIDCIIAQRKRKRMVSVSGKKIEAAGKYVPAEWENRQMDRTVVAAPSKDEDNLYYFTYRSKKNGNTLVVFQPDKRVKDSFYQGLPRLIQLEWDK